MAGSDKCASPEIPILRVANKLSRGVDMDQRTEPAYIPYFQHTLKESFTCISRGLHSGLKIVMRVTPAEANTGIVFASARLST